MDRTTTGGSGRGGVPPRRPRSSAHAHPDQRPRARESDRERAARLRAERRRQVEAARFRRAILLVLGTLIVPGSAQLVVGNRRLGTIVVSVWAGMVGIVALVVWQVSAADLAQWAIQPAVLTSFKVAAIVLALGWIVVIVDAWRLGDPPSLARNHRLTMVGVTIAVAALVTTPFVVASQKITAAHDAVVAMFPSGEVAAASAGRLNFLLLGADAGDGRVGVRPDTIMLVSVDVQTGQPAMISLPRNLEKARFAEGTPAAAEFPRGFTGTGDRSDYMLNATWTYGEENPEIFPGSSGPGPTAVKQAVEGTLGMTVHYYAALDLQGFEDFIDALGGITLRVEEDLVMGDSGRILEAGLRELDGSNALWYARSRTGSSDYARMSRQRCVIGAILREADPSTVVANFEDLAEASESIVTTDIPQEDLGNLISLAMKAKDRDLQSLQFVPPLITSADPDFALIRDRTEELLEGDLATEPPMEADAASAEADVDDTTAAEEEPAPSTLTSDDDTGDDTGDEVDDSDPVAVESVCAYE